MTDLLSAWWAWGSLALIFAILELLAPGFIFLGFAFGAAVVGLVLLGSGLALAMPVLLLIFAVLSLVSWLVLRRVFARPTGQVKIIEDDIND